MAKFNEKLQEVGLSKSKLSRVIQLKIDKHNKLVSEGADAEALEKLDNEITDNIQTLVNKRQAKPPKEQKPKVVKQEEVEEEEEEEEAEEEEDDEEYEREYQRKMQEQKERYRMREEYERSLALRQQQQQPEPKKSKAIWLLAGLVAVVTLGAVILKDK